MVALVCVGLVVLALVWTEIPREKRTIGRLLLTLLSIPVTGVSTAVMSALFGASVILAFMWIAHFTIS